MKVWPGRPYPLGATWERVEWCPSFQESHVGGLVPALMDRIILRSPTGFA
jgi:hypothetical protein